MVLFFLITFTLGRRFTFWAMRRVADLTALVNGQLSLVLVLAFAAAAVTEGLGLHALLGSFTFGVLLSRAPRATMVLKESIQVLTVGFFAPVFFVLAGMRVDIFQLSDASSIGVLCLLFAVATFVTVFFSPPLVALLENGFSSLRKKWPASTGGGEAAGLPSSGRNSSGSHES